MVGEELDEVESRELKEQTDYVFTDGTVSTQAE